MAGSSYSQLGVNFIVSQVDDYRARNYRPDDLFAIKQYGFAVGLKAKEASITSNFDRTIVVGFFPG